MVLTGKCIFIIEDNVTNATIMKVILQANGAKVFIDRWGRDPLARIREVGQVDLIIMDLMLQHGVSGYEVFDVLRTDPTLAKIPVVIVSASDPALELNKARQKGFCGYISKPIDNLTFARTVASIIEGKSVWADDFSQFTHDWR